MNDLRASLKNEFADPDARYAYAESSLNSRIAAQIKVLREQRGKTQEEMATLCGTKQGGYSRFEDVNHSVWKTDSLWKIARALSVRLTVSFETFGSLIEEKEQFNRAYLERPDFDHDPAFTKEGDPTAALNQNKLDSLIGAEYLDNRRGVGEITAAALPHWPSSDIAGGFGGISGDISAHAWAGNLIGKESPQNAGVPPDKIPAGLRAGAIGRPLSGATTRQLRLFDGRANIVSIDSQRRQTAVSEKRKRARKHSKSMARQIYRTAHG